MIFNMTVEEIVATITGVVTAIFLAYKKITSTKDEVAKEQTDLFIHIRGEKADAIKERDKAESETEKLRSVNVKLETKIYELRSELSIMSSRLLLLTELNNRLSSALDETQGRLETFLHQHTSPGELS